MRIAMQNYENRLIRNLVTQLGKAGIKQEKIDHIMKGGEKIYRETRPKKKAEWIREAMLRMNKRLDLKTRKAVREACACRLTGRPLKASQAIARKNKSLESRIRAANDSFSVFGGCVAMWKNGRSSCAFFP